jgi:nitronate monooxygenase
MPHALLAMLGVEHPIVLAPMGGPSTPELVAAVSGAGGLGILGAPYLSPAELRQAVARIRALTDRPFGVNLFAGGHPAASTADAGPASVLAGAAAASTSVDAGPMLALLAPLHARLGLPPPTAPALPPDPFPAQLDVVLELRPPLFSFTFGIPPPAALAALRERGIRTAGTATTVAEARALADAGVDAVMAQGAEAGGHRGTFLGAFAEAMVPTLRLVREVVRVVSLPVIAAGGIMEGADARAALEAGAAAVALGTAFLACPESGAAPAYKQALLAAGGDHTVLTRAFSGRPARGLENGFVRAVAGHEAAILPYPLQNALTRPMRTAAGKAGDADLLSLWAGQGVARIRALPAAVLVGALVRELAGTAG